MCYDSDPIPKLKVVGLCESLNSIRTSSTDQADLLPVSGAGDKPYLENTFVGFKPEFLNLLAEL